MHQVVLFALTPALKPWLGIVASDAAALAVALALASLVHRWIERPFARLRRHFSA
jgi:peptidoglycan/LPS O-acetylase OafA/YrhL